MERPTLYFGCALSYAPKEYRLQVLEFKDVLRQEVGATVLDFVGLEGDPEEIVEKDTALADGCDLFVPDFSYPSTGLGWELRGRFDRGRPMFPIAHRDAFVAKLVIGAVSKLDLEIYRYQVLLETIDPIRNKLRDLNLL